MSDREDFERTYAEIDQHHEGTAHYWFKRRPDGRYSFSQIELAWEVWQAARSQGGEVEPVATFNRWWDTDMVYFSHKTTKGLARAAYNQGFKDAHPQPAQQGSVPDYIIEALSFYAKYSHMGEPVENGKIALDALTRALAGGPTKNIPMGWRLNHSHGIWEVVNPAGKPISVPSELWGFFDLAFTTHTPQPEGDVCHWTENEGMWNSECGYGLWYEDGTPSERGQKYCPSCGKPCIEVPNPPAEGAE